MISWNFTEVSEIKLKQLVCNAGQDHEFFPWNFKNNSFVFWDWCFISFIDFAFEVYLSFALFSFTSFCVSVFFCFFAGCVDNWSIRSPVPVRRFFFSLRFLCAVVSFSLTTQLRQINLGRIGRQTVAIEPFCFVGSMYFLVWLDQKHVLQFCCNYAFLLDQNILHFQNVIIFLPVWFFFPQSFMVFNLVVRETFSLRPFW